MEHLEITVSDAPSTEERSAIIGGLVGYNDEHAGLERHRPLTIVARSDGAIAGGLLGFTHWNWLFISHLWLAEACRGSGVGRRLISAAEAEAVARGCAHAHCDTFEFQALPFYRKIGYTVFGKLEDYPPGFTRYYLQKRDLKM
jgi:ribosomal protein S18 acetylase RimI-like enzyme